MYLCYFNIFAVLKKLLNILKKKKSWKKKKMYMLGSMLTIDL